MQTSGFVDPGLLSDGFVRLALKSYQEDVDLAKSHVPFYEFEILEQTTGLHAGGIVLRAGYNPHVDDCAGHIGYGIDESFRGKHFAARATRLVCAFARKLNMPYVIITTKPDNIASQQSARLAGFAFVGTSVVPEQDEMYAEGDRIMSKFMLRLD